MNIDDLGKFPVNTRGYTVIPVITLTKETMNDSLVGLKVTIGLGEQDLRTTDSGIITGFDEDKIYVKVGAKEKKFDYDPVNIQLQVYQFDRKILFSNERVSEKELAKSNRDFYNESPTEEKPKSKSIQPPAEEKEDVESKPKRKTRTTRKKTKSETKPKKTGRAKKEVSAYQPKYEIEWS